MVRFRNSILTGISLVVLFAVGTITNPRNGYGSPGVSPAAPSTQTQNVNVVNTPGVIAQQAGVWSVGISGTPVVGLDASNNTVKLDANNNTVKLDPAAVVSVHDIDNAHRVPFGLTCVMDNNQGFPCALTAPVPVGKVMVIEMFQGTDLTAVTGNVPVTYHFPQSSQLVRIYVDTGSAVTAVCGLQGTQCAITGYFADAQ
jgi:hypothetical protein